MSSCIMQRIDKSLTFVILCWSMVFCFLYHWILKISLAIVLSLSTHKIYFLRSLFTYECIYLSTPSRQYEPYQYKFLSQGYWLSAKQTKEHDSKIIARIDFTLTTTKAILAVSLQSGLSFLRTHQFHQFHLFISGNAEYINTLFRWAF